jgi:hypothetical protein
MNPRWVLACATAEAVGMAASAGAARGSESSGPAVAFALVVAGGLVEGTALGWLQAERLHALLGRRRSWVLLTVLVAGVGWAAGSAPATLSPTSGDAPALASVLVAAAGLGLVMGVVLGAAQAVALRGRVRHPWRWVVANGCGWALAMPVVFGGATTAGAGWSLTEVVGYGAVTGALAGTVLGLVTGVWLPVLDGPPLRHRLVLAFLTWRRHEALAGWTGLAVTGRLTGRTSRFPVMCAPLGDCAVVVLPGHPAHKSWWRQLGEGAEVGVLDAGTWRRGRARVLPPGSLAWSVARSAYVARWPKARVEGPLVVVDLPAAGEDQRFGSAGTDAVRSVGAGA